MIRTGLMIGAFVLLGVAQRDVMAQTSSLFGSSGPRAATSSGSTSSASGSSTGTSAGTSGMSAGGMSATVNRSSGAGGAGGGGVQQPQLNQLGSLSSQAVGNGTGFVGQQNQGAFVGNRMAGTGGMSMMQPSFGSLGGGRGGADFNSQNGASQGSSSTRSFRPRYRVGFDYRPPAGDVARRTAVQAERLQTTNPALSGLQIAVSDEGVAEIRGQAPTQDARLLIENLVRLEPGVRQVTNLVEVVPTPPTAASP